MYCPYPISWESKFLQGILTKFIYQKNDVHFTSLNIDVYITQKNERGIYTLPTLDIQVHGK